MNRQHYVEVPVVEFSIVVMGYYIQFVISYFIIVNMKTDRTLRHWSTCYSFW